MTEKLKPCPFCGGEVYHRVSASGVTFFNCIHCNAVITFSRAGEEMSSATAKALYNKRAEKFCIVGDRMYEDNNLNFPIPVYLKHDLDLVLDAIKNKDDILAVVLDELEDSVKVTMMEHSITREQGEYLVKTFGLW